MHSVEKNEKFFLTEKKISSNQLFSNFFSKTIAFTKFLRQMCEREFLQFPHCGMWYLRFKNFHEKSSLFYSVEITEIYSRTNFWQKFRENNVFPKKVS